MVGCIGASVLTVATAITLPGQAPDLATVQVSGMLGQRLDSILQGFEGEGLSGSFLVVTQGQVRLLKGYGYADRRMRIRNEPTTLFELGSLTKPVTAAAVLRLAEQGRLRLDARLSTYLTGLPTTKAVATVHQLATHTGGMVRAGAPLRYDRGREAFLASVWSAETESEPGAAYRYSNAGFSVLAAVVEVVTGESFEQFVHREVLERAGLGDLAFVGMRQRPDHARALGYRGPGDEPTPSEPYDWGSRGASGLIGSVGDLLRWHEALRDGRVLGPDALALMFHPWAEEGYGWHVEGDPVPVIHKGGGLPAFATQLLWYPGPDVFIAWATNDTSKPWRRRLNAALEAATLCSWAHMSPGVACAQAMSSPR